MIYSENENDLKEAVDSLDNLQECMDLEDSTCSLQLIGALDESSVLEAKAEVEGHKRNVNYGVIELIKEDGKPTTDARICGFAKKSVRFRQMADFHLAPHESLRPLYNIEKMIKSFPSELSCKFGGVVL